MALFIDTSDLDEIRKAHRMGILRGVTTNPSILLKEGVKHGAAGIEKRAKEIAGLIDPLPLSMEVTSNDPEAMLEEARTMASWARNINVKITIHGPQGELENVEIIHRLERQENIRVNVTAMMSAQQCFLAALAGASYVSLFGGRVNDMGVNCLEQIRMLRRLLDSHGLESKIIVGSTREALNVIEWLDAGAHIVTVTPSLIAKMLVHPYSKETVQQFLADAAKVKRGS
ncbi:MAG: transaldolase [Verrucomicrobiae bacterium]|nr:transaldolase [Verrucomicrobiae bacterium]